MCIRDSSYTRHVAMAPIIAQFSEEEHAAFNTLGYTIGGMMVFPSNRVDGKMTINGARGFHRRVADRMDLTLECIRRHYRGEPSPLGATLARYADFFALFDDFGGYVDFFPLQDLVTADGAAVRFFMPFDDFEWRAECDHEWSLKTGNLGKGLKAHLPADVWSGLESTFTGADPEANWKALFDLIELFGRVACEVGGLLGYTYPSDLIARVTDHARRMREGVFADGPLYAD